MAKYKLIYLYLILYALKEHLRKNMNTLEQFVNEWSFCSCGEMENENMIIQFLSMQLYENILNSYNFWHPKEPIMEK